MQINLISVTLFGPCGLSGFGLETLYHFPLMIKHKPAVLSHNKGFQVNIPGGFPSDM